MADTDGRWSDDLPADLLRLILRRLPCQLDRATFRAVCCAWRHLPPPLLCFNNECFQNLTDDDEPPRPRFDLPARHYSCCDDWLLYINDDEVVLTLSTATFTMFHPLSGTTIAGIPLFADGYEGLTGFPTPKALFEPKVIVCLLDLVATLLCGGEVAFCRPGDRSWSVSLSRDAGGQRCDSITDITLYCGKIFAVDSNDHIFVHELMLIGGEPKTSRAAAKHVIMALLHQPPATSSEEEQWLRWLVVCRTKLLMVRWSVVPEAEIKIKTEEIKLKVFEAGFETRQWLEVNDLGDHALFIGSGCSKAIRMTSGDDQRFQGNRVYFLGLDFGHKYSHWVDCRDRPTYGYYDLKNGIFLPRTSNVWPQHSMQWFFPCE
ncbi:hypothetical protein QOZ80_9BG0698880 [Eleusine coracana subsp. coracana]|nr:hypothetical protein QOZ80_9BG0698880 [Eleusine coracana subsp. coracana]